MNYQENRYIEAVKKSSTKCSYEVLKKVINRDRRIDNITLGKIAELGDTLILLDGRRRIKVCAELGIEITDDMYTILEFTTLFEAREWVLDVLFSTPHLEPWEKCEIGLKIHNEYAAIGERRKKEGVPQMGEGWDTYERVANRVAVSPTTYTKYYWMSVHYPNQLCLITEKGEGISRVYKHFKDEDDKRSWKKKITFFPSEYKPTRKSSSDEILPEETDPLSPVAPPPPVLSQADAILDLDREPQLSLPNIETSSIALPELNDPNITVIENTSILEIEELDSTTENLVVADIAPLTSPSNQSCSTTYQLFHSTNDFRKNITVSDSTGSIIVITMAEPTANDGSCIVVFSEKLDFEQEFYICAGSDIETFIKLLLAVTSIKEAKQ